MKKDIYWQGNIYVGVKENEWHLFYEHGSFRLRVIREPSYSCPQPHNFKDVEDVTGLYELEKQVRVVGHFMKANDQLFNDSSDNEKRVVAVPLVEQEGEDTKLKAMELFTKMRIPNGVYTDADGEPKNHYKVNRSDAKKCAIIAVDEIIELADRVSGIEGNYFRVTKDNQYQDAIKELEFWQSVKDAITNLK